MNYRYLGVFRERTSNSDEPKYVKHPHIGAGIAIDKRMLEADLFALTPPDFKLYDGYDCVTQLVVTEQAIPRF